MTMPTLILKESVHLFREVREPLWTPIALNSLGFVAYQQGEANLSEQYLEESLAIYRAVGAGRWDEALPLANLARIARDRGDVTRAARLLSESLAVHARFGEKAGVSGSLRGLAMIAGSCGQPEQGAILLGAAEVLRESIGVPIPPMGLDRHRRAIDAIRSQLAPAEFEAAWAAGRRMTMEQAVADASDFADDLADAAFPRSSVADSQGQNRYGLSPRELEVLRIVAEGLTDPEVAERLYLSPRTVSQHLRSIYSKLGVTSRTAATRLALDHGLV